MRPERRVNGTADEPASRPKVHELYKRLGFDATWCGVSHRFWGVESRGAVSLRVLTSVVQADNKQLQRTVIRQRGRTRQRAAAELRRHT